MKKRKTMTGIIMAVTMGICTFTGNVTVSYGMTQNTGQLYAEDVSGVSVTISERTGEINSDAAKIKSLHNPIVDASTGAVTFSYVYFGSYPQSEVTGEALTAEIIEADYEASDVFCEKIDWDGQFRYNIAGEVVVDGQKYRRMEIDGQYYYFKYEPIKWQVLKISENQALLKTEKILDYEPYGGMGLDNAWEDSYIREWLNGSEEEVGFVNVALNEELEALVETEIPDYSEIFKIFDKVFLCSAEQLEDCGMLNNKQACITYKSDYANFIYKGDGIIGDWWVRDYPGASAHNFIPYIDCNGKFYNDFFGMNYGEMNYGEMDYGEDADIIDDANRPAVNYGGTDYREYASSHDVGICPAVTLDLTKTELWMTEEEIKYKPDIPQKESIKGDMNGNQSIELEDAQIVLKMALRIIESTDADIESADVDEDTMITLADAQKVLKAALGIEEFYECNVYG